MTRLIMQQALNALVRIRDFENWVEYQNTGEPDDGWRSHGHEGLQAIDALRKVLDGTPIKPTYTTGHCRNHKAIGGCQLHNLQCGYPACDRQLVK